MANKVNKNKWLGSGYGDDSEVVPFDNIEELWFWFISAQSARNDGARFSAGQSSVLRPCEPVDILNILDRLYRQRMLVRDHFLVLRYYGRRMMPPDRHRVKEARAYKLWWEAFDKISPILERKGILQTKNWAHHTILDEKYQGGAAR